MKKKIIIAVAVIAVLALVVAFTGKDKENNKNSNGVSIGEVIKPTESTKAENETEKNEEENKDPDKIVKIELPLSFIEEKYQNDLDRFVEDNGYKSAKLKRDKKTVEIEMRALSYDIYLTGQGISTMRAICETFESKDYPYVKNLGEYESDFSFITLLVDGNEFKKSENIDNLFGYVANCCAYYLLQDKDAPEEFKIDICGVKNKKLLATRTYNLKDYLS